MVTVRHIRDTLMGMIFGYLHLEMANLICQYNLNYPIMKNIVPLCPYGWTTLRFHCHIEAHLALSLPY
ncbi:hypothetical protein CUMW_216180 [Citrus unshiu]|uniref:Plastocyanin-like domain-containing protein n=1 Tax=Citrus unshiu TaxID=55188 RepID=A0A2H5QC69_CITUN|nr:hypothetical protein CUMW_216180 [Citrus unshiu]